jgi:hypothetical protein
MNAAAELRQMLEHKPLFPETEAFKRFELQKERKTAELKKNYPDVRLS